jgi:hypothetical protein
MDPTPRTLRGQVKKLEDELQRTREDLTAVEKRCDHQYTITYEPIHHKGYDVPGDEPGTMGVDWRGPYYVPPRIEERWKRSCARCGREEYTTRVEVNVETKSTRVPVFHEW